MAVLSAVRKTKYKVARVFNDTGSMSGGYEPCYLKVKHLTPVGNVTVRRHSAKSCSVTCCIVGLALVSLTLNVVVSIYLWSHRGSTAAVKQSPYSADLTTVVHKDSVCTTCSSLGIQPESDQRKFQDLSVQFIHENFYFCCLHNAHGLKRLISLFEDRFRPVLSPDKGTEFTPVNKKSTGAHLYIDSEALKSVSPTLSWTKEYGFGSAYNSRDVLIDGNQFHITKPGLYHIYSFITFKTKHHRLQPDNVVHTVNRRNTQLPELGSHVILIAKTTLPEVSERFMTSFLSATVRLRKDDQIFVRVSNLSYVYEFEPSNFFGLYFVGE